MSITTFPSDSLVAPSIASNNLDLQPSFIIKRSITTSIRCFLFLSRLISSDNSKIKVYVVPTDEELMIAKQTLELIK